MIDTPRLWQESTPFYNVTRGCQTSLSVLLYWGLVPRLVSNRLCWRLDPCHGRQKGGGVQGDRTPFFTKTLDFLVFLGLKHPIFQFVRTSKFLANFSEGKAKFFRNFKPCPFSPLFDPPLFPQDSTTLLGLKYPLV